MSRFYRTWSLITCPVMLLTLVSLQAAQRDSGIVTAESQSIRLRVTNLPAVPGRRGRSVNVEWVDKKSGHTKTIDLGFQTFVRDVIFDRRGRAVLFGLG